MADENTTEIAVDGEGTTREQLMERLQSGARIDSVTISRTETRQKAQFTPNQYFLSLQLKYTELWDLVEAETDTPERKDLGQLVRNQIHDDIMRHESYISGVLMHMQMKDEVPTFPRRPDNPALAASNLQEALQNQR